MVERVHGANASGWDWIGINLDDGGALMAFRMRDRGGGALWTSATHRDAAGQTRTFVPTKCGGLRRDNGDRREQGRCIPSRGASMAGERAVLAAARRRG